MSTTDSRKEEGSDPVRRARNPGDPLRLIETTAALTHWQRGEKIYSTGDPADHWYRVVSGMARLSALLPDGRRQIVDLLLPGDFFGFSVRREHYFAVEAVVAGTVVSVYPRARVETLLDTEPALGRRLLELALESLCRLQSRIVLLGRMNARQKVGSFLAEMAERFAEGPDLVVLPMSRYDIADYLALSVETVSRALTHFKHRGAINLADTHRVQILDRAALEERNARRG